MTLSTVLVADSFNVAPNAPTLGSIVGYDASNDRDFTWTFSDDDPADAQSAFQLQIEKQSDSTTAVDTTKTTSTAATYKVVASTLTNNIAYRWRVKTWDTLDSEGSWSDYATFTPSDIGYLTIDDPATDDAAGIDESSYLLKWTYHSTTETQASYEIVVTQLSDSTQLSDTGTITGDDAQAYITNLPSGERLRVDLSIVNTSAQAPATVSRYMTTKYLSPDKATIAVTLPSDKDDIARVTITSPSPAGDKPAPNTVDIFRSIDSGTTWLLVGTVIPVIDGDVVFDDVLLKYGEKPQYIVRSNASTGYVWSDQKTASAGIIFAGARLYQIGSDGKWDRIPVALVFGKSSGSLKLDVPSTKLQFAGRGKPVVQFGQAQGKTATYSYVLPQLGNPKASLSAVTDGGDDGISADSAIADYLEPMVTNRRMICIKDSRRRLVFGVVTGIDISDQDLGYQLGLTLNEADYDTGTIYTTVGA